MVFRSGSDENHFDKKGEFVPAHIPEPGPFLADHDVLTGDRHVSVHTTAETLFKARGVYDMTFGYNLAKLNRDTRHPDAGFRYAKEREDPTVLRIEFTPTTEFCPQSDTLAKGAFRAWNGLLERHEYDRVRVRVAPTHDRAEETNAMLSQLDTQDDSEQDESANSPRDVSHSHTDRSDVPF